MEFELAKCANVQTETEDCRKTQTENSGKSIKYHNI